MARPQSRTLQVQIFAHKSPRTVFKALTAPEQLTRWFMDHATLSPRRGGSYAFHWDGGPTHTGRVLDFVPGKNLTLTWQWPGQEKLGVTKLRFTVNPRAGGSVIRATHSGFGRGRAWDDLYEGTIRGWTYFLMNLKSVLETGHDLRSPYDW